MRTVLETDSSDTEALFVLSGVLQVQNRTEEAARVLAEFQRKRQIVERINALLKDVDSAKSRADDCAEVGQLFFQIGRDSFGVYWLEQALERDPNNQTAHRALAEFYERKGDAGKAKMHRATPRTREMIDRLHLCGDRS